MAKKKFEPSIASGNDYQKVGDVAIPKEKDQYPNKKDTYNNVVGTTKKITIYNSENNIVGSNCNTIQFFNSSNNNVQPGLRNVVFINSNGINCFESDVTYINGIKFKAGSITSNGVVSWGGIGGTLSLQTDLKNALDAKQPLDGDLTAIAALTSNGFAKKTGTNTWTIDTNTYLTTSAAASTYVPYTGATADVDLGTHQMNAQSFMITGVNGNGHIHLKHQASDAASTGSSTVLFADSNGDLKYKNDGLSYVTFVTHNNTANRSYTFPDRDLTIDNITTATTTNLASGFLKSNGSTIILDTNTYLTAEADTLQTVTTRGAITTTSIEANSFIKTGGLSTEYLMADGSITTGSGASPLSSITSASATNTINNANHNQVWNWQSTGSTGTRFSIIDSNTSVVTGSASFLMKVSVTTQQLLNPFQVSGFDGGNITLGITPGSPNRTYFSASVGGAIQLLAATTNTISAGTNQIVYIGNTTLTNTINIANTSGSIANIGSSMITGTINIGGTGAHTGLVTIANGTGAQTINIASAVSGSVKTINIGTAGASNVITIGPGAAFVYNAGNVQINNNSTNGNISMGAAQTLGTITIGGTGGHIGTIAIAPGTGNQTISIANSTGVKTIDIGTSTGANVMTISGTNSTLAINGKVTLDKPIKLKGYTVATLPAGVVGDRCYVTDALAPVYLTTVVGGGAVVCPVFFDGINWIS